MKYLVSILLFMSIISSSLAAFADEYDADSEVDNESEKSSISSNKNYSYEYSIDKNASAFAGADLSTSLIEAYRQVENKLVPNQNLGILASTGLFLSRYLVTQTITTFQHEVYGHGARLREFGWKIKGYQIDFGGGGSTSYYRPLRQHPQKDIVVVLGGVQAEEVLANKIKSRIMMHGVINPVYGMAYLNSITGQTQYILATSYKGRGHDILSYINQMNRIYGRNFLTKSKVKERARLDLLDPFLYFGAYAALTNTNFEYPMIPIGDIGYLPGARALLTPYGLESKLINYIRFDDKQIQVNLTHGRNLSRTSGAAEVIVENLRLTDKVSWGFGGTVWRQPKLLAANPKLAPIKTGGSIILNSVVSFNNTYGMTIEGGYKTAGYQVGRPIEATPIIRLGLKIDI